MTQWIRRMADQPYTGGLVGIEWPDSFMALGQWNVMETLGRLRHSQSLRSRIFGEIWTPMGISIHHGAFVDKELLPSIPRASWNSKRHLMGIPRILRQITQHHESISYIYIYRVNKTKKNMWKAKGSAFGTTSLVCFTTSFGFVWYVYRKVVQKGHSDDRQSYPAGSSSFPSEWQHINQWSPTPRKLVNT